MLEYQLLNSVKVVDGVLSNMLLSPYCWGIFDKRGEKLNVQWPYTGQTTKTVS